MATATPTLGGELDILRHSLNRHRKVVLWKIEDLTDEQLSRPMTPSGTNLIGLVKHLAAVEYGWFCATFGRPVEPLCDEIDAAVDSDPTYDLRLVSGETPQQMIEFYQRACVAADAAIEAEGLDAMGTSWSGTEVSMRWVAVHMVEEIARHAGHMDIVRELIDGATGDHDRRDQHLESST